jgi:O-antigen/teichoic acid export membrane protein
VFGRGFSGVEPELYVLLASQLIVVMVGLPGQLLNMTGRQHVLRNIALAAATVNVLLSLLLIPSYGIMGACWAQFSGTFIWNVLCVWSARRHFGFWTTVTRF